MASKASKNAARPVAPPASVEQAVMVGVMRVADLLTRNLERTLRPSGLTPTQFNVLRILRGARRAAEAGHPDTAGATADGGLMCSQIAGRMVTRDPDITRLIARLKAAGLVERKACSEDRRRVLIRITPRGMAELAKLDEPLKRMQQSLSSVMDPASIRKLAALLGELHASLKQDAAE